jgi:peptidyl-prolyl cis-trans isomerase C
MKVFCLLAFASLGALFAQTAPGSAQTAPVPSPAAPPAMPNLPDDAEVAIFGDGTKLTMGEFRRIYEALPPANQQMALRNRSQWLHQWELLRKLTKMAEDAKLDQQSPYKESLEYGRMNVLATAEIGAAINLIVVEPADIVKYYESNKRKYTTVRVKAIYIAFNDDAAAVGASKGKKPLTEAEAKAKAAKLLAAIKGGADFVKLVKENSDDETSREKDGDFATLHANDNIPDAFRAAVFALKQGDVSEPLKQPNGFYLLRAEEVTVRPLSEVRDDIYGELKNIRSDEWLRGVDRDANVRILSPEFITGPPPPAKQ